MAGVDSESAPHHLATTGGPTGERPAQPEPFLRGAVFPGTRRVPYPRADPVDRMRLPGDTWMMASLPVGVRLELVGDAGEVEIRYTTTTDQLGYRGDGAGRTFQAFSDGMVVGEVEAALGEGVARLPLGGGDERTIVYLPEGMRPTIREVTGIGGDIAPAPAQPRWVVYGDSVAEGWIASSPAGAWPAIAGREQGLDVVNLGYAGAARGEIPSAEQVAKLEADLITVCHGTNCWTRTPHSAGLFREGVVAFLDILREEHPDTPILVVSPVVRPDAEATPNRLGASLADLRDAMEEVVARRQAAGDERLELVRGLALISAEQLGDGIHPDDAGHAAMAAAIGARASAMIA